MTKASSYGGNHDPFRADRCLALRHILTVGYMVSRGIAKAGSRQPYDEVLNAAESPSAGVRTRAEACRADSAEAVRRLVVS